MVWIFFRPASYGLRLSCVWERSVVPQAIECILSSARLNSSKGGGVTLLFLHTKIGFTRLQNVPMIMFVLSTFNLMVWFHILWPTQVCNWFMIILPCSGGEKNTNYVKVTWASGICWLKAVLQRQQNRVQTKQFPSTHTWASTGASTPWSRKGLYPVIWSTQSLICPFMS